MYKFDKLTEIQQIMVCSIISTEVRRAERHLQTQLDNLAYQKEYSYIFHKDGTINETEKKVASAVARLDAARALLASIEQ